MRARMLLPTLVVAVVAVFGLAAIVGVRAIERSIADDADAVAAIVADVRVPPGATPQPAAPAEPAASLPSPPATPPATQQIARTRPPDALLAAVWPVHGTGADGPSPTSPPVGPPATDLAERLQRIVSHPDLAVDGGRGVAVVDRWGREVVVVGGREALLPASTNKLVVAAAALELLGAQARFRTALAVTAPPDAQGVVEGDLVLIGGGDPVLASPRFVEEVYPSRPHTSLLRLVEDLRRAGVTRVTGRVVADSRIAPGASLPSGWPQRYLDQREGTRVSGLSIDAGLRMWERESDGVLLAAAAEDPAAEAAIVLSDLLRDAEVSVDGDPEVVADGVRSGGVPAAELEEAQVVATVTSPPLSDLLAHMVQHSDNHVADMLFRLLGAVRADGTWQGSGRAVRAALADLDLDWQGVHLADGSGLSRADRLTPLFLAQLDRVMHDSSSAQQWRALMAVAAESGTLRARYRGTPAAGRVLGKTGALRDVRALAGSVDGARGSRFHFAVIGSELSAAEIPRLRRTMDLVVYALAADERGCGEWRPPTPPDATAAPHAAGEIAAPPEAAVCA